MHASVHGILDSFTRDKHNEATCKTCMKTARYMYTVNGHTHTQGEQYQVHTHYGYCTCIYCIISMKSLFTMN